MKLQKIGGQWRWLSCFLLLLGLTACDSEPAAPTSLPPATALPAPTIPSMPTPISSRAVVAPTVVDPTVVAHAIYVAPTGDDANPGTRQQPLRTIQVAVDQAQAGDTVYVRQGVYHEVVTIKNSGRPDQPLTVAAYPGERPVIDGAYRLPEGEPARWNEMAEPPIYFVWGALVRIRGSHVRFSGFEIKHSLGRALLISNTTTERNQHVTVDDCLVHDSRNSLVRVMSADYVTVENCQFFHASDYATHNRTASELNWPAALATIDANHVMFRYNLVHENWSSGISPGVDSRNITIENNIIYNHLGQQIYVHRSQAITVRNNLVYHTNDPAFRRAGNPSSCIALNNELGFETGSTVSDVAIEQNIFVGCQRHVGIWRSEGSGLPIQNVTITNNTLVNATSNRAELPGTGLFIAPGNVRDIRFERNLILQNEGELVNVPDNPAITYRANGWSRTPPEGVSSATDLIGDPHLQNPHALLVPGQVQPGWYGLTAASAPGLSELGATDFYTTDHSLLPLPKLQIPATAAQ